MKKILSTLIVFIALAALSGCAALQTVQTLDQDAAAQVAAKIAAKRIGYAVAKNNPQYQADMIVYAKLLYQSEDIQSLVNDAMPVAIDRLGAFASDPLLASDIADLVRLIKIKGPDVAIPVKSALAKAALAGFIEGCEAAK